MPYVCSHIPYIPYTVTYTLHYIAYMAIVSFFHVHYIVLVRYEGGMGRDPSPLEGGIVIRKTFRPTPQNISTCEPKRISQLLRAATWSCSVV